MQNNDRELRVLVMAPVGQDARAIAELLTAAGCQPEFVTARPNVVLK